MIFQVKVIPNSKEERIIRTEEGLTVKVKAKAINGKANKALIDTLSRYFKVKKSEVIILSGEKARRKRVEIRKL